MCPSSEICSGGVQHTPELRPHEGCGESDLRRMLDVSGCTARQRMGSLGHPSSAASIPFCWRLCLIGFRLHTLLVAVGLLWFDSFGRSDLAAWSLASSLRGRSADPSQQYREELRSGVRVTLLGPSGLVDAIVRKRQRRRRGNTLPQSKQLSSFIARASGRTISPLPLQLLRRTLETTSTPHKFRNTTQVLHLLPFLHSI